MQRFSLPEGAGPRTLWLKEMDLADAQLAFVFLDAELYLQRVQAIEILEQLPNQSRLAWLFIENGDAAARHRDLTCDPSFTQLVGEQIPSWLQRQGLPTTTPLVLAGLSLSGLAALHTAICYPHAFRAVISQSPSCWWQDEHFRKQLPAMKPATASATAFWLSVGDAELESDAVHSPAGLVQSTSQLESCRRTAADMQAAGYCVHFHIFSGGHNYLCWRDELVTAATWAITQAN